MNRDYILGLPVGEELNNLVTHEIMGYENNWSESISAAWEVVEKLTQEYRITLYKLPGGEWSCKFSDYPQVIESTAPKAISKSALLTVLEEH